MNCVNCGSRLTFFNETDELWGGTERALCLSCRKVIDPFLDEGASASHIEHLSQRKAALIARGLTAEGYAHLEEYCRYLDTLLGDKAHTERDGKVTPARRVSPLRAIRESMQQEPALEATPVSIDDTSRALLDAQGRANRALRGEVKDLSASLTDTTRLFSDRLEGLMERLRLLTYLAIAGAATGTLSILMLIILLIIR